jgi:hypothetical protein
MHTYMHACIHTYIHTHTYGHANTQHIHTYMQTCTHTRIHIYTHTYQGCFSQQFGQRYIQILTRTCHSTRMHTSDPYQCAPKPVLPVASQTYTHMFSHTHIHMLTHVQIHAYPNPLLTWCRITSSFTYAHKACLNMRTCMTTSSLCPHGPKRPPPAASPSVLLVSLCLIFAQVRCIATV